MPALGMVIAWFGYTLTSWGYIVVKGYDVTLSAWANPMKPYTGAWPPAQLDPAVLLPGGSSTSSGNAVATANITGGTAAPAAAAPATTTPATTPGKGVTIL